MQTDRVTTDPTPEPPQQPKSRWLAWVIEESAKPNVDMPWSRTTRGSRAKRLLHMNAGFSS